MKHQCLARALLVCALLWLLLGSGVSACTEHLGLKHESLGNDWHHKHHPADPRPE
jgi:hypothetical protein